MANLYIPSELDGLIKEAHERHLRNSDAEYLPEWEAMAKELFTDDALAELRDRRGGEL